MLTTIPHQSPCIHIKPYRNRMQQFILFCWWYWMTSDFREVINSGNYWTSTNLNLRDDWSFERWIIYPVLYMHCCSIYALLNHSSDTHHQLLWEYQLYYTESCTGTVDLSPSFILPVSPSVFGLSLYCDTKQGPHFWNKISSALSSGLHSTYIP